MEKVLRASKIGFPCARNLWYSANGYEGKVSEKSQRIFDAGTAFEPFVVEWLRSDGWTVDYNPGSQNAELEVSVPVNGGVLKEHPDCFISRPDGLQNVLADIKTMNDRAFTIWKREGSVKDKPQYVEQLHVYALGAVRNGHPVEHLAIVGVNKNNSEMHIDIFDFDPYLAADIQAKAEVIFAEETPPDFNSPEEIWCCGYCEFADLCALHTTPDFNTTTQKDTETTSDEEIINAMKLLQQARSLSKESKEIEATAKGILDANLKAKGWSSIQGGGLVCSVSERTSSRFDTAAFKKVHPELVREFTKQTTSTVYDVKELKEGF